MEGRQFIDADSSISFWFKKIRRGSTLDYVILTIDDQAFVIKQIDELGRFMLDGFLSLRPPYVIKHNISSSIKVVIPDYPIFTTIFTEGFKGGVTMEFTDKYLVLSDLKKTVRYHLVGDLIKDRTAKIKIVFDKPVAISYQFLKEVSWLAVTLRADKVVFEHSNGQLKVDVVSFSHDATLKYTTNSNFDARVVLARDIFLETVASLTEDNVTLIFSSVNAVELKEEGEGYKLSTIMAGINEDK